MTLNAALNFIPKRRPATSRREFEVALEKRRAAAGAHVRALLVVLVVLARARALGAFQTKDLVLLSVGCVFPGAGGSVGVLFSAGRGGGGGARRMEARRRRADDPLSPCPSLTSSGVSSPRHTASGVFLSSLVPSGALPDAAAMARTGARKAGLWTRSGERVVTTVVERETVLRRACMVDAWEDAVRVVVELICESRNCCARHRMRSQNSAWWTLEWLSRAAHSPPSPPPHMSPLLPSQSAPPPIHTQGSSP